MNGSWDESPGPSVQIHKFKIGSELKEAANQDFSHFAVSFNSLPNFFELGTDGPGDQYHGFSARLWRVRQQNYHGISTIAHWPKFSSTSTRNPVNGCG